MQQQATEKNSGKSSSTSAIVVPTARCLQSHPCYHPPQRTLGAACFLTLLTSTEQSSVVRVGEASSPPAEGAGKEHVWLWGRGYRIRDMESSPNTEGRSKGTEYP